MLENVAIATFFPRLQRLSADVSPAYLRREIALVAAAPPQIVFLGDSVVWGYRLPAGEAAVSILARHGCPCVNLAIRAGSLPNDYALARLLLAAGVRPRAVVLQIDQQSFNPADAGYARLLPGIADLSASLFSPSDRRLLSPPVSFGIQRRFDDALSSLWLLYGMRADIRDTYFPSPQTIPVTHPTADMYLGTYDLTPLTKDNVAVHFLTETVDRLRAEGIPVIAFMTPTNHKLLHDYIDSDAYRANGSYLKKLLTDRGVRVLDLDTEFPSDLFFDNAHLRSPGQRLLAEKLNAEITAIPEPSRRTQDAPPVSERR